MLLTIILSDFQQYRTILANVIQLFVSPEKCENQRYEILDSRPTICEFDKTKKKKKKKKTTTKNNKTNKTGKLYYVYCCEGCKSCP